MNTNELLTYNQVAELAGVSISKLVRDRSLKRIFSIAKLEPKIRFTRDEAREYAEWISKNENLRMDFDLTKPYKFLPTGVRTPKFFGNPAKYRGGIDLGVSADGDFINLNRMKKIKPYKTGHGHLQIRMGNGLQPMAHDLVNLLWNDNSKFKPHVHHINGIMTDNRAGNLISLFEDEHKQAHKLLDQIKNATTKGEKAKAKKAYRDFIKQKRADNKENHKEDLRIIDDLDYPSDDEHQNYMVVTEKSWEKYLETGNDMDLVIRGEFFG